MDLEGIRQFVVDAHERGYAVATPERGPDGAKEIEYRSGEYRYLDRYYGSRSFLGSEIVFREEDPIWGMHYSGAPVGAAVDHERVYAVLRSALENVTLDDPFRGPPTYVEDAFEYRVTVDGSFSRFSGAERIVRDGSVVYRGRFGGGILE